MVHMVYVSFLMSRVQNWKTSFIALLRSRKKTKKKRKKSKTRRGSEGKTVQTRPCDQKGPDPDSGTGVSVGRGSTGEGLG